ncbi:MAG: hypothetical protein ACRDN0_21770 [Trebonia sp.]
MNHILWLWDFPGEAKLVGEVRHRMADVLPDPGRATTIPGRRWRPAPAKTAAAVAGTVLDRVWP